MAGFQADVFGDAQCLRSVWGTWGTWGTWMLDGETLGISSVVPLPRIPVTTRIIIFLVGDPELKNLHLPLLLGGWTTQNMSFEEPAYQNHGLHNDLFSAVAAFDIIEIGECV